MGIRIYQLPPALANQIAAGEVIERPASVVKELLENCLDSGADTIHLDIGYGGLNHIKISDNGCGIVEDDLPLAIAAHATSKIKTLNDLYAVASMGFRGEALASIASIAKLSISSRPAEQEHAMILHAKNDQVTCSPCARVQGTTIEVCDLFFNAPVRKRFLKGEKLEYQAIEHVVKRFALSASHIAITLKHNNKLTLSLPAACNEHAQKARMSKILGLAFMREAIFLDVEHASMRLHGWISSPAVQRSQNDRQWVYINQRMVKDKLLQHALKQAYEGRLHPGRFPCCILYLTIKPEEVDVNVHPTKHEVRFQQPRLVHDFFTSQLTKALTQTVSEPNHSQEKKSEHIHTLCEPSPQIEMDWIKSKSFNDKHSKNNALTSLEWSSSSEKSTWIRLNAQYSLIFVKQQPYIVNVHELQKFWLLEQLKQSTIPLASRPLLVPLSVTVPNGLNKEILGSALEQLGIKTFFKEKVCLQVLSLPLMVPYLELGLLLELMAEEGVDLLAQGLEFCVRAQKFDSGLLSQDEQMALGQMLVNENTDFTNPPLPYKLLTLEDCRMLLHV
jgi:DNA mismatch repair protein MutL